MSAKAPSPPDGDGFMRLGASENAVPPQRLAEGRGRKRGREASPERAAPSVPAQVGRFGSRGGDHGVSGGGGGGGGAPAAAPWRHARGGAFASLPARAPLLRLHEEILDFAAFMAPTPAEQAAADGAIERIRRVIEDVFPGGRMEIFGSRANGLVLPTSDWDVVLFGVDGSSRNMHRLGAEIEARGLAAAMEVIDSARVPIIKMRERESGISVDISFESSAASGVITRGLITDFVRRYPPVRPLVLVLKYFLLQRRLNETYSGGVGSFLLVLMVVHVVRQEQAAALARVRAARRGAGAADAADAGGRGAAVPAPVVSNALNLGALLLSFLELFGHNLNYVTTGITVRGAAAPAGGGAGAGGSYYSKAKRGWADGARPWLLSVENPADASADVGRNSWGIGRVRRAFAHAHTQLSRALRAWVRDGGRGGRGGRGGGAHAPPASLLGTVVRHDSLLLLRAAELRAAALGADRDDDHDADADAEADAGGGADGGDGGGSDARPSANGAAARAAAAAAAGVPAPAAGAATVAAVLAADGPTAAEAHDAALAALARSGVSLRRPGRLADIMTRRERGVEELAAASAAGSWY